MSDMLRTGTMSPSVPNRPSANAGFRHIEATDRSFPIFLSVPHAGRDYPDSLLMRSRVTREVLIRLEDRFADLLISDLIGLGCGAVIAELARAAIDLNRDPRDIDRQMVADIPRDYAIVQSVKQRGGLGLFPRSLPRAGELWRRPLRWTEAVHLLEGHYGGYHQTVADSLRVLRERFGQAMLVDVHSMPPLNNAADGTRGPDIVIGDRFGASTSSRYSDLARNIAADHGFSVAVNHPYPGYYLIERHGKPATGLHALQIEISRDLYLDSELNGSGAGLPRVQRLIAELGCALRDEMIRGDYALAAE